MTENLARHIAEGDQPPELRRQFDLVAASWDAKHGPASARAAELAARVRYLRSVCGGLGRPRVLDLGCGTGEVLRQLSPVVEASIGVDISRAMIESPLSSRTFPFSIRSKPSSPERLVQAARPACAGGTAAQSGL